MRRGGLLIAALVIGATFIAVPVKSSNAEEWPLGFTFGEPVASIRHKPLNNQDLCRVSDNISGRTSTNFLRYGDATFKAFKVDLDKSAITVCAGEVDGVLAYIFIPGKEIRHISTDLQSSMIEKYGEPKISQLYIKDGIYPLTLLQWKRDHFNIDLSVKMVPINFGPGTSDWYKEDNAQSRAEYLLYYTDAAIAHFSRIVDAKIADQTKRSEERARDDAVRRSDNTSRF
jgi:hypothetical protein